MYATVASARVGRLSFLQLSFIFSLMASNLAIPTSNHSNTKESTNATLLSERNSTHSELNTTTEALESNHTSSKQADQKKAQAELWKGVEKDDGVLIQRAFSSGADLEDRDRNGFTPLIIAIKSNREEAVRTLIKLGADVERTDNRLMKRSPLEYAALYGRLPIVDQLIAAGAKVDSRDAYGWTPLMSAAFRRELGVVKRLVEAGANVTAENQFGFTALMKAERENHQDVIDYLRSVGGCDMPSGSRWPRPTSCTS